MKNRLFKTMVAVGAFAMICACGDDSASNSTNDQGESSASVEPGVDTASSARLRVRLRKRGLAAKF